MWIKINYFHPSTYISKCRLQDGHRFVSTSVRKIRFFWSLFTNWTAISPMGDGTCFKYWLCFNSLATGKYGNNFKKWILNTCYGLSLRALLNEFLLAMSENALDDISTMDQVMAWCHQAANHYMSQCWPRFMSSYVIIVSHLYTWSVAKSRRSFGLISSGRWKCIPIQFQIISNPRKYDGNSRVVFSSLCQLMA